MGWFTRDLTCQGCGQQRPKGAVLVSLPQKGTGICADCGGRWAADGRLCAVCGARVHGTQEVAYFPERRGFGHYDCAMDAPGALKVTLP